MGDNLVNLKVVGNLIQVICYNETQQQSVIKNMTKPGIVYLKDMRFGKMKQSYLHLDY